MRPTCFIVLLSACSDTVPDGDAWGVGELNSVPNNTATNNATANNALNHVSPNNTTPPDLPTCVDAATSMFQVFGPEFIEMPMVSGDRVFVTGSTDADPTTGIYEWTEEQLTRVSPSETGEVLVGASETFLWLSAGQR